MKNMSRGIVVALAFAGATLVSGAPVGCASEEGTTGKRVTLELRVVGSAGARASFTNAAGWSVTLDRALLAVGPATFYDGATIFSRAPLSFSGRTAHAHPGHYVAGEARGEVSSATAVDLRDGATVGAGPGVSGMVRSATFRFSPAPGGALASELGAYVAVVLGTATKDGASRRFRAEIAAADVVDTKGEPAVEGCPFTATDVQVDGVVTLTVKVEAWFDQVDFTDVAPGDAEPALLAAGSLARNTLVRGLKAGTPYAFTFAPR